MIKAVRDIPALLKLVKLRLLDPDDSVGKMLRPYQRDLLVDVVSELQKGNWSIMAQLPTGGGKSVCFKVLTRLFADCGLNVLICAHRNELVNQAAKHVRSMELQPGLIKSGRTVEIRKAIQVASIPTMHRRLHIRWEPDVVIYDEAHHVAAKTWLKIKEKYANAFHLGFTATPCRTDGRGFEEIFDVMVLGPTVEQLMAEGFLCGYKLYGRPPIDVSHARKTAGDFNQKDLQEAADQPTLVADLVKTWVELALGDKTIVFAVSPDHSKHIVNEYNELGRSYFGKDIAAHIDGETPEAEREEIIRRFALPDSDPESLLILSNFAIVTEGFDVPETVCVQLARPTASLALHLQMIGRGLRPAKGKAFAKILDHAGNLVRFGPPDLPQHWQLEGIKPLESPLLQCPDCGSLVNKSSVRPLLCDVCEFVIIPEKEAKPRMEREQKDVVHDTATELQELNFTPFQFAFLAKMQESQRKSKQGRVNKSSLINWLTKRIDDGLAKDLNLLPTFEELQWVADQLEFKRGWAMHQYRDLREKKKRKVAESLAAAGS